VSFPILSLAVRYEHDVVAARQRARQIAGLLGFDAQDQTRIATAVSEIARNAFAYAGGGRVEFLVEGQTAPQLFLVRISDQGPGIADLPQILEGDYRSSTGMGLGLVGARRLMDHFDISSTPGRGTTVVLKKMFPARAPFVTVGRVAGLADALARLTPQDPLEEVQQQNRVILESLE
jgi:anti-sigma regulatory factor (Ser/Thr protein kinase)